MAEDVFSEFGGRSLNLPERHNNPLNLKVGPATKKWIDLGEAEPGESATDGGTFLRFKTPEAGRTAAHALLSSPAYSGLTVDAALKKWSNSGYGAEITGVFPDKKMSQLSTEERDKVVSSMERRESGGGDGGDSDPFAEFGGNSVIITRDSLLNSRKAASKSEFDANNPGSTLGSRAREAAIGVLEPFTASTVLDTAKSIGGGILDAMTGKGTAKMQEVVKGAVTAPIEPVKDFASGVYEGDYDKAAYGAGGILSKTVPAVEGVAKGVKGVGRVISPPLSPEMRVNSLMQVMKSAIKEKGTPPQVIAADAQPRLQQAYHEFGLDPEKIPDKNTAPNTDAVGDLVRGGTAKELAKVNEVLKAEHTAAVEAGELPPGSEFIPAQSVTIAAADRMVDIAHRPIGEAMKVFDEVKIPEVKQAVVSKLIKRAKEEMTVNPKLGRAYMAVAKSVEGTGDTVGGLNRMKVQFNKAVGKSFQGTPSQQIAMDINPIQAQQEAASMIRKGLYPAVEDIALNEGRPMHGKLLEAGRREANAITTRDGIYSEWTNAAGNHAPFSLRNYLKHTIRGHSETVPIVGSPFRRPAMANAVGRALTGPESEMRDFNKNLRDGVGPLTDFTPERVMITPVRQLKKGTPPDSSYVKGEPATYPNKGLLPPAKVAGLLPPHMEFTIQGGPTIQRILEGSGTSAKSIPLPARKTGLDYGKGRYSDELQNWQYTGEVTPDTITRPEGPGQMVTSDPQVVKSTIAAIDEAITSKGLGPKQIKELTRIKSDLQIQLKSQESGLPKPPKRSK